MVKSHLHDSSFKWKEVFDQALSHHRARRYSQADELYQKILTVEPSHDNVLHLSGVLAYQTSQYERALELIGKAIKVNGKKPEYYFNQGLAYQKLNKLREANCSYKQALRLKSDYVEALSNLGNVLREMDDIDAAIDAYKKVIQIKPNYSSGYNNLGVVLKEKGQFEQAIQAFGKALELNPSNAESHFNLGSIYLACEQVDQALHAFQEAIKINSKYAKAHHSLGIVFLWKGQLDAALTELRISANLTQNHGQQILLQSIFPSRISHDLAQFEYLSKRGIWKHEDSTYQETLKYLKEKTCESGEGNNPIQLGQKEAVCLAPSFNRIIQYADNPILLKGVLNPELDIEDIQCNYNKNRPEIVCIDGLLREEALKALRQFCLESTIWKKDYTEGYIGTFFGEGFSSPMLLQIAEELRTRFPEIFHQHRLLQAWAFKQDSQRRPLNIHADSAAVNVNFWITQEEANLDPSSGGLIVWDKEAPKDWDFKIFNNTKYKPKIMEFLQKRGASPVSIPYRENRALIFNSNLFHESDRCVFRDNYECRRINITFLYGHRSRA